MTPLVLNVWEGPPRFEAAAEVVRISMAPAVDIGTLRRSARSKEICWSTMNESRLKRLSMLTSTFGVPLNDVARMLLMSQDGLRAWMRSPEGQVMAGPDPERLAHLHQFAAEWGQRTSAPLGALVRRPLACIAERSLLGLLSAETFEPDAIRAAFDVLEAETELRTRKLHERPGNIGSHRMKSPRSFPKEE